MARATLALAMATEAACTSLNSYRFSACPLTATSTWPGLTCPMSMNATACSSSYTLVDGIWPATILQNTQSVIALP